MADITVEQVADYIEGALTGIDPQRGIWSDRDYLISTLAMISGSERARNAMLAKPLAIMDENKPLQHKAESWWWQYEQQAVKLENDDYTLAADDIRTLVSGLRDLERKLGERSDEP